MEEMKICPYCGEKIKASARKCRYCKTWLEENDALEESENIELPDGNSAYTQKDFGQKILDVVKYILTTLIPIFIVRGILIYQRSEKDQASESEYVVNDEEDNYIVEDTCYMDEYQVAE